MSPFNSGRDVETRLADPTPLTPEEIRDLFPWMNQISEVGMRRLKSQLALQNIEAVQENIGAVQKFEQSSSRLAKWLVWLTAALVALTLAVVYYSSLLVRFEKKS